MKIVFITDNFPPVVDGVGDYTYNLGQEFANNGHQVYVICSRKEAIIQHAENINSITVLPIILHWNKSAISTILKSISHIQPDWIVPQYVPYSYNYYGMPFWFYQLVSALKQQKYRLAITFHEVFIDLELDKPKYIPVALAQRAITYLIAEKVDHIIVSIERVRLQLRRFDAKMTRIPIGSNIRPVTVPETDIIHLRKKMAPKDEFIIASFGIRDQVNLVHLLHRLLQEKQNVKLALLGKMNSPTIEAINKLIGQLNLSDKIYLTGFLSNDELYATLRSADAFIMLEENRGGVTTKSGSIAAAYAAGLPIIGTKGHMTDYFFVNGENILFTDVKSLDKMTSDFKNFIQNKDNILNRLKKGSKKTYEERLSWEKIYNAYLNLLN